MVKIQQIDIDSLVGNLVSRKVPDGLAQLLGVALAQLCAGIMTVVKPPNDTPFTGQVYTDEDVKRVYYFAGSKLLGMVPELIARLAVESKVSDDPTIMPNPNPAFTVGMQAVNEVFTPAKALALGTSGR